MLDLDGLKLINDTHGHPIGAHTIAEVGKIIGTVVSPHGAACRFGGDEFAAFLPDARQARRRQGRRDHPRAGGRAIASRRTASSCEPTISIGVSAFPEDGPTAELLLRKADEALYRAKKTGRDRVRT